MGFTFHEFCFNLKYNSLYLFPPPFITYIGGSCSINCVFIDFFVSNPAMFNIMFVISFFSFPINFVVLYFNLSKEDSLNGIFNSLYNSFSDSVSEMELLNGRTYCKLSSIPVLCCGCLFILYN